MERLDVHFVQFPVRHGDAKINLTLENTEIELSSNRVPSIQVCSLCTVVCGVHEAQLDARSQAPKRHVIHVSRADVDTPETFHG